LPADTLKVFGVLFGTSAILVLLALAAVRGSLKPMRLLAYRMRRLAAGEQDVTLPQGGMGEAGELNAAFRVLVRNLRYQATRLEDGVVELARPLVHALEVISPERAGHAERVRRYCMRMADRLELLAEDRRDLELAAMLHDLGKPSRRVENTKVAEGAAANDDHAARGASLLAMVPGLQRVATYIKHHHERFDGSGDPEGLHGERIPLASRLIAIADGYDRLTRVESSLPWDLALDSLQEQEGRAFDPWLLELFSELIREDPRPHWDDDSNARLAAAGRGNRLSAATGGGRGKPTARWQEEDYEWPEN
jgi:putative nucleotidyltransferase with HDIG domain